MKLLVIISVAVLLMVGLAYAGCDNCSDSSLACTGDSEKQFLDKCGSPAKIVDHYNRFREVIATTYYYDLGKGRFIRTFTFRNGQLTEMGTISR